MLVSQKTPTAPRQSLHPHMPDGGRLRISVTDLDICQDWDGAYTLMLATRPTTASRREAKSDGGRGDAPGALRMPAC
jgi:hypothetical protein